MRLLPRLTCPHCWTRFAVEDILWISTHTDLRGDPRLGADHPQRFLPTRFTPGGEAIDAKGFPCTNLACPHCHLGIPRAMLEMEPFFVSILGAPSCGKSYYLAALVWELRRLLPEAFGLAFGDADPTANLLLSEYEKSLFLNPAADQPVPLGGLIRKTELQGDLYDTVAYGNQAVSYPRPFLFWLKPTEQHPNFAAHQSLSRVIVMYDNAGEHCLPGQDSVSTPATQHLAQSRLLMYLFDPLQDVRFRKLCRGPSATSEAVTSRQESILHETASRIRKYHRLSATAKHKRPLTVVVTKYDAWSHLVGDPQPREPRLSTPVFDRLDRDRIDQKSHEVRQLLQQACPEVVSAAEDFASDVRYVPVSALGSSPVPHPQTGKAAIRPADIKPIWATVPLLVALHESTRGLISERRKGQAPSPAVPANGQVPQGSGSSAARP
jgi:hypothetical protein